MQNVYGMNYSDKYFLKVSMHFIPGKNSLGSYLGYLSYLNTSCYIYILEKNVNTQKALQFCIKVGTSEPAHHFIIMSLV